MSFCGSRCDDVYNGLVCNGTICGLAVRPRVAVSLSEGGREGERERREGGRREEDETRVM